MDYGSLIQFHVRKILMVCSNYDAFILREDGEIEYEIRREYMELGLTTPPSFVWVNGVEEAYGILSGENDVDLVIFMYSAGGGNDVFVQTRRLKAEGCRVPMILLTSFSHAVESQLRSEDSSGIDLVFTWHGSAELILAIVKLLEDKVNSEHDITECGVQAILLVEDSVRFYSTYLPELYKIVLTQSYAFFSESLNTSQLKNRKRARPKILFARTYNEALGEYERYSNNLLGVITDMGFANDYGGEEVLDAGLRLLDHIKKDDPQMPVLVQSAQDSVEAKARALGAGFLKKYSKTLILQLSGYIRDEFCFGDFVFRDRQGREYGRVGSTTQLVKVIEEVPEDVFAYVTSKNMLSKWLFARGLFDIAGIIRKVRGVDFRSDAEHKAYLCSQITKYLGALGQGIIADFNGKDYGSYIWFSKMGQGSLGGKARGLAFLNHLIDKYSLPFKYPGVEISIPRTIVIATDYFDQFILENDLQYVIESDFSDEEVLGEFVSSTLPSELVDQLKAYLLTVRTPLAIRSSSRLEDSSYQPFAGVYTTYFVPLVDNREQMLRILEKAIKSVYASIYYGGSRNYIQSTGNLLSEEKMAVIVQSVCGHEHEGLFFPMMSGVARSMNSYPLGREKSSDGVVNVAFGLGKTVVDGGCSLRFDPLYPKKVMQLSEPQFALRDTQKMMYALELSSTAFKSSVNDSINLKHIPVAQALKGYPLADLVASTLSRDSGRLNPGARDDGPLIVSFDNVLKYGDIPFARMMRDILEICRRELGCEVEVEFAFDTAVTHENMMRLKLLQVRPVQNAFETVRLDIEAEKSKMRTVYIESSEALGAGKMEGAGYMLYVPPESFDSSRTVEIAAQIKEINEYVRSIGGKYILVGPGRWGSADPWLGIPVEWGSISEALAIVEYNTPEFRIEPSQGSHFFQNITSLGVGYLTVDAVRNPEAIKFDEINSLFSEKITTFARLQKLPAGTAVYVDCSSNAGFVGV